MKKGTLVLLAVLGLATVMLSFLLGSAGGMLTAMWQQQKNAQTKFEMLKAASVSDIAEQCTESVGSTGSRNADRAVQQRWRAV